MDVDVTLPPPQEGGHYMAKTMRNVVITAIVPQLNL